MKLLVLLLLFSCSQKFQTYHIIDKQNFNIDDPEVPITPKLKRGQKVSKEVCHDQILFANNAVTDNKRSIQRVVQNLCGESRFLMDARLTEDWWTTIIYSKSCMTIEGYCSRR